ncbi:MAG: UDP-N-acetylglucosamine 1-carboxyvinyltransferase [Deltaproteobacteria bacterium]|nr:UDP-N-acetylglucosamine 1-carboxyvinyltransferase [Deltaproteobacteria bacterium]MBW2420427.1 UDP-N-acetylglucosamine 1-carboxyvinyltransferase [Deltaproteobacteria bacterium]
MSKFVINGGRPIRGHLQASGNKNSVLPIIAACLLTEDEIVLENVPAIRDVASMLDIAAHLGAEVKREGSTLRIRAAEIREHEVPRELCEKTRTSFLFTAPLLHRMGRATLFPPGGDLIGRRRLDAHFYGLEKLGCEVEPDDFQISAPAGMQGSTLFFDEASVTATEHILMAAVLAAGTTEIRNAASEPHVQELAEMLVDMGARIEGIKTNTLVVTGVERLSGVEHRIEGDHIEAGSYLALAAATGGDLTVEGVRGGHFWMIHRIFERFGLEMEFEANQIHLPGGQEPCIQPDVGGRVPRVDDGPWPQFPSDLMSALLVLATQTRGTVLFFEKLFESRMYFVDPLIQMGANIIVCDPHRVVVTGKTPLTGQTVRSPDIRAGMALMMAALCARRRPSIVQNAEIVDRGYENIEGKLRALGADIERVDD